MKKKKVIIAMSGGVDSSVAALLMKKKGYDCIGVFLKCWSDSKDAYGECTWKSERREALKICNKLDIPLVTIDAEKDYKKYVIEEMFKDYKKGITPNPDVLCNEVVKFPYLLKQAKKLKADFIVTGHFARIKKEKEKYFLLRAKDESKDQSYFLYRLKEKDLKKIIFPIGEFTKEEVRKIAKENGFENSNKKSTVGICFIGKTNMKDFLKTKIKPKKGKIIDTKGNTIGSHDGVYFYTIGQRIGPRFGIDILKKEKDPRNLSRWYVAKKDIKKNLLVVAPNKSQELYRKEINLKNLHLINQNKKDFLEKIKKSPRNLLVRIRHVGELVKSKISYDKKIKVTLGEKLSGVSNGQAIILYEKEKVLGGGTIS